jgi:hypothetical protein
MPSSQICWNNARCDPSMSDSRCGVLSICASLRCSLSFSPCALAGYGDSMMPPPHALRWRTADHQSSALTLVYLVALWGWVRGFGCIKSSDKPVAHHDATLMAAEYLLPPRPLSLSSFHCTFRVLSCAPDVQVACGTGTTSRCRPASNPCSPLVSTWSHLWPCLMGRSVSFSRVQSQINHLSLITCG